MVRTPIGLNIRLRYVQDIAALRKRLADLKPAWCVLCIDKDDHAPYVIQFAKENPDIKFIARVVDVNPDAPGTEPRDGKWHLKPADGRQYLASPEDFLNRWGELGKGGLTLNVSNEPNGYVDKNHPDNLRRLAEWTLDVLKLATARGISLCVLNFATGHPVLVKGANGTEWVNVFDDVLKYVSEHRQHVIGLHEYLPGIGIDFRVGRLGAMVNRCTTLGIKPPRVVITEAGVDYAGEKDRDGYISRGWGSDFYADALYDLMNVPYKPLLEAGTLEGACVFVYADQGRFKNFDVETDDVFHKTLLRRAQKWAQSAVPPTTATTTGEFKPVVVPVEAKPVEPKPEPQKVVLTIELTGEDAKLLLALVESLKKASLVVT